MVPSRDAPRVLPIPPRGEPIGSDHFREKLRRLIFIEWLRVLRQQIASIARDRLFLREFSYSG
jgi:hypothetical protein